MSKSDKEKIKEVEDVLDFLPKKDIFDKIAELYRKKRALQKEINAGRMAY